MITKLQVRTQCNLPAVYTDGLTIYQAISVLTDAVNNCIAKIAELDSKINNTVNDFNTNIAQLDSKINNSIDDVLEEVTMSFDSVRKRIAEIEGNQRDMQTNITDMSASIESSKSSIIRLDSAMESTVANINEVGAMVQTDREDLVALQTWQGTANTQINTNKTTISAVNKRVDTVTNNIVTTNTNLTALSNNFTDLSEYIILYSDPGWIQTQTEAQLKQLYDEKTRFITQGDGTSNISYLYGLFPGGTYTLIAQTNS